MGRVVRSAVERSRIVEAYKSSGLSVAAFAPQASITPSTLYQWVSRAKEKNTDVPAIRVARVVRRRAPPKRTAKVRQDPPRAPKHPASSTAITIEVGAVRLHVSAGVDADMLTLVLNVIEARARHGVAQ